MDIYLILLAIGIAVALLSITQYKNIITDLEKKNDELKKTIRGLQKNVESLNQQIASYDKKKETDKEIFDFISYYLNPSWIDTPSNLKWISHNILYIDKEDTAKTVVYNFLERNNIDKKDYIKNMFRVRDQLDNGFLEDSIFQSPFLKDVSNKRYREELGIPEDDVRPPDTDVMFDQTAIQSININETKKGKLINFPLWFIFACPYIVMYWKTLEVNNLPDLKLFQVSRSDFWKPIDELIELLNAMVDRYNETFMED